MWIMGFVGMATKYGEAVLAVKKELIPMDLMLVGQCTTKNGLGKMEMAWFLICII